MYLGIQVNIGHHSKYIQQLNVTCSYSNLYCTILMWWYHNHRSHTCPPDQSVNVQFRFKYFRSQDQVTTLVWHTTCNLGHMYAAMIMYIWAQARRQQERMGAWRGWGLGAWRVDGRDGGTRGCLWGRARLGPVWDRHVFKGTSSTSSTSFLFRPLLVNSVTNHSHTFSNHQFWWVPRAENLIHATITFYLYCTQSVLLVPGTRVIWYHYPITLSTIFSQNLVCRPRQNKYAEHQRFQRWSFF